VINWRGRIVEIIFDSDARVKVGVQAAQAALMRELSNRAARPSSVLLPEDSKGADDFLKLHTIEEFDALPRESFALTEPLYRMNEEIAFVHDPHSILTIEAETFHTVHQARERFANRQVVSIDRAGKVKIKPLFGEWMQSPLRRDFKRVEYEPGQPREFGDHSYNTWKGWAFKPRKPAPGDLRYFYTVFDHLFPPDDYPAERKWFLQWCAYPIQFPGTKLHSAVVMFGNVQGSGKSLMGEILAKLYGDHSSEIGGTTLGGAFNEWIANKSFIVANEIANRKDLRLDANGLKNLISNSRVLINKKHVPTYFVRDPVNYYFTSNHYSAIYMDDDDRRYFAHKIERKIDPQLGYEIGRWKSKADLGPLLGHLMYEIDTTNFIPTGPPVFSRHRETMIDAGRSDLDSWCQDLKANPMPFLRSGSEGFTERDLWRTKELAVVYKHHNDGRVVTDKALGNALRQAGFLKLPRTKTPFGDLNLWAISNSARWRNSSESEREQYYVSHLPGGAPKY